MAEANKIQYEQFKEDYCKNDADRFRMNQAFEVNLELFWELLPTQEVNSFATGTRKITGSFIIFKVYDVNNDIEYYPVFSETVGRKMLNTWNMPVPEKKSIFLDIGNGGNHNGGGNGGGNGRADNPDNKRLRKLILFSYALMTFDFKNPKPMYGVFKQIYDALDANHYRDVNNSEIKSINTILGRHLAKNPKYTNLQDFISEIQQEAGDRRLRNPDFDSLRDRMRTAYPAEQIYF